jgi:DNA-binding CsgD family transcriptional regulator
MARTNQIRLKDQREAYRLLMECCDLGANPLLWRRRMFEGLCRLVGAHVGIGGEMRDFARSTQRILQSVDVSDLGPVEREHRMRYVAEDGIRKDPVFQRFARLRGPLVTRSLEQLIDRDQWHASEVFNRYMKPGRMDSRIISFRQFSTDPRTINAITLHRATDEPAFNPREVRLVHLFHHELGRLLGHRLAVVHNRATGDLPPRLRQVLNCLMEGNSEKQVARRLGLSQHTVHTYINRLHRRFNVQSRGELLSRCLGGQ